MNTPLCYNDVIFEERLSNNALRVMISVNDKNTESSRIIFNESIPVPLFVGVVAILIPLLIPFIILLFLATLVTWVPSLFTKEYKEISYEDAKERFRLGKGYINNLSDAEKKKLATKNENNPLGL